MPLDVALTLQSRFDSWLAQVRAQAKPGEQINEESAFTLWFGPALEPEDAYQVLTGNSDEYQIRLYSDREPNG